MFVYNDCEYYAFAAYEGEVYEVTSYRNSGNPYTVKTLVPHARENPSQLEAWVTANKSAFIRRGENAWSLVTGKMHYSPYK